MTHSATGERLGDGALSARAAGDGLLGWVPALVVAYITLLSPLFVVREFSENSDAAVTASQSNAVNQLFWIGLFAVVVLAGWRRLPRLLPVLRQPTVLIILAFLAFSCASVLWSPVPGIAFRRVMLQVIVVFAVVAPMFMVTDRAALLNRIVAVFLLTVAVNVVPVLTQPAGPIGHEGIYAHKNQFGLVAAYAFVFALFAAVRYRGYLRWAAVFIAAVAILELVVSRSKTSLGLSLLIPALSAAVIGLGALSGIRAVYLVIFGALFGVCGYLFFNYLFDYSFADLSLLLFDDTTFTGRTEIWDFIFGIVSRQPVFGQGYGSFWGTGAGSIVALEAPGFIGQLLQSHNGYVDVLLETGAIGFGLLLLLVFFTLFDVGGFRGSSRAEAWLVLCVALFAILHNMLESSWFRGYTLAWLMFLIAAAYSAAQKEAARRGLPPERP